MFTSQSGLLLRTSSWPIESCGTFRASSEGTPPALRVVICMVHQVDSAGTGSVKEVISGAKEGREKRLPATEGDTSGPGAERRVRLSRFHEKPGNCSGSVEPSVQAYGFGQTAPVVRPLKPKGQSEVNSEGLGNLNFAGLRTRIKGYVIGGKGRRVQ